MNSERSGGSENSPSEPYTPRDRVRYKVMVGVLLGMAAVASFSTRMPLSETVRASVEKCLKKCEDGSNTCNIPEHLRGGNLSAEDEERWRVASCANAILSNNWEDPVVDAGVVERVEEEARE
jgi:hypothetical protein